MTLTWPMVWGWPGWPMAPGPGCMVIWGWGWAMLAGGPGCMWIWGPGCIWGAGARVGRPGGPDMAMLTTGLMLVMAALAILWA